jgi:hypothetical protein
MGGRSFGRLLVIGVLVGAPRGSAAQATLLVESYVEERPADADRVLAPLRDRLQRRGAVTSAAAMAALLGPRLPLPAAADPALTATELAERIDLGFKSALRGDYRLAVHQLEAALEAARENPSLTVSDESSRVWLTKALAGLGFARGRLGDPAGAVDAMAEQIRSFPEHPVTRDAFGPEAEKLYRVARGALDGSARGTLLVEVNQPDAQIYINEVGRGRGRAFAGELFPGTYRVLVEASGVGRRYTAAVRAGEETRLSIDWDIDARLTVTPRWVGFVWPRGARERMSQIAARLSRGGALDDVIVVGIVRRGARRFVVGHAYSRTAGTLERAGSIELGETGEIGKLGEIGEIGELGEIGKRGKPRARDTAKLVALADYLASGVRTDEAVRLVGDRERAGRARGSRALVWASAGVAVAAFGSGGYLIDLDGRGTCGTHPLEQCPRLHATAPLGWTLIGGGIAAVAFGAYWYAAHGRPRAPAITLRSGAGGFAAIAWSF